MFVSYEELIREAWGGNVVSRHTVATTIGAIRKALNEYGSWIAYRPKLGYRLQVPEAEDLVRTGWHFWQRRTREGVERALACFEQAARQNPSSPEPLDGITSCYLTLATFGMRPPEEVYELFREAQTRAVGLRGWTAKLRSERGRLLHTLERRFDEAESEFRLAQEERPTPVGVFINLAMLHASGKRFDDALAALALAHQLNPLHPTLGTLYAGQTRFIIGAFATITQNGSPAPATASIPLARFMFEGGPSGHTRFVHVH